MVNELELRSAVKETLADLDLTTHAFYDRWENGDLSSAELREYAEQYRLFEASFPGTLSATLKQLPEGDARNFIADNLADEVSIPSHLTLFESFLSAAGGSADAKPMPAMQAMLDAYEETVALGPAAAIGAVVAYEVQSPAVASKKGNSLRKHYGYDETATNFWDVHAVLDVDHGDWALTAMASATQEGQLEQAVQGTRKIAEAWWNFLDERESRREALSAA